MDRGIVRKIASKVDISRIVRVTNRIGTVKHKQPSLLAPIEPSLDCRHSILNLCYLLAHNMMDVVQQMVDLHIVPINGFSTSSLDPEDG